MDYEYSVEPKAIASDWKTFRFVWSLFGFSKGRLISQFPKKWFKEVYNAIDEAEKSHNNSNNLYLIRKNLEEERKREINYGDCRVKKFNRQSHYINGNTWITNALNENKREKFAAIIAQDSMNNSSVISVEELDEKDLRNKVSWATTLTEDELISAFNMFLRFGCRIAFIDPYFRIDSENQHRIVRNLLSQCLSIVSKYNPDAECEIHYRDHENNPMPSISYIEGKSQQIASLIPDGMHITIHCWRKHNAIEFHDRYLLTDNGGLQIGKGFRLDEGESTSVGFSSAKAAADIFSRFNGSGHHLVDYALRIDSKGGIERIYL